jgi:hypothetical protein
MISPDSIRRLRGSGMAASGNEQTATGHDKLTTTTRR